MLNIKSIFSIARAESIISRRLVRYWVFLGLAYLIAILYTLQLSAVHGFYSSISGTVGGVTPRFLMSVIGIIYAIIFILGTIFLAFDIRARDNRERIAEVLDSRPHTNLELVSGRFLGVFLVSWIPIIVLSAVLELFGLIMKGSGLPFGEPIEIYSLLSFIFIMAVPALSFVIALVFFITLLVRSRLAAAVILIALLGLTFWGMSWLRSIYGTLFDITGFGSAFFTSEIISAITTSDGFIQRLSILFAAFSLIGFSSAIHPRLDGGSRPKLAAGSTVLLVCALFFSGTLFFNYTDDIRTREVWKETHAALTDEIIPDLKKISGSINIAPGKDLSLDLDIVFGAPEAASIKEKAIFTLNPGLKVESVSDTMGNPLSFTNGNGLLNITLPKSLSAAEETGVHLTAHGPPDDRFAYLYSAYNPEESTGRESGDLPMLGLTSSIFDNSFIALVPALRWLPSPGPEKDRDDPGKRDVDYFDMDLKVKLPTGWLAAGPGRRHKIEENSDGVTFRFSPQAPVPEAALVASRFESRSMEVEGVNLEILINKKHTKNLQVLADTEDKIREWVGSILKEGKEYGLDYPYGALTLAEVPNVLRSYGGGWRLDTSLAAPGMLLMRETGFPTARFDSAFRNPERFKDREGGIAQAKWVRLKSFFSNDFSGGNIISNGSRNFFLYQTSARGPEGLALNYIMETLSNLLITDTRSYFSAHQYLDGNGMNRVLTMTITSYARNPSNESSIVDTLIGSVSRPEVWDFALSTSLRDMDPWKDPARTVDILTLKTNPIAQSILDTLGHEKTRQFLASIRESHKGTSFTYNDVVDAGKQLGYDLTEILGDWFDSTDLPGFICEKGEIYRIPDSEGGNPRYQLLFTIRNDEPAPGLFHIVYYYNEEGGKQSNIKSDPIRMDGKSTVQVGTVVSGRPAWMSLNPYLSLNRGMIYLPLNTVDENKIEKKDAFEGVKELSYSPLQETSIIVDDLDPGFSAVEEENGRWLRRLSREDNEKNTDQGLPVTAVTRNRLPSKWSRAGNITSYGKYRHTLAGIKAGEGEKKVLFEANIDKAGKWDLEMFVPWKNNIWLNKKWGIWHIDVVDDNGDKHEIEFDSKAAAAGWNLVKAMDLPEGKVRVELSDQTDGDLVVADAIKWTSAAGN